MPLELVLPYKPAVSLLSGMGGLEPGPVQVHVSVSFASRPIPRSVLPRVLMDAETWPVMTRKKSSNVFGFTYLQNKWQFSCEAIIKSFGFGNMMCLVKVINSFQRLVRSINVQIFRTFLLTF